MSNWTTPALERLEHYLEQNRLRAAASGADGNEVVADLRQHIENEVTALKLPAVTEEDVQRIIARTGAMPEPEAQEPITPLLTRSRVKRAIAPAGSVALVLFGVLLPLTTLIIELATHICAGTFFDPLPTWLHVALVATVPGANFGAWWLLRDTRRAVPRWLWWLNAAAVGSGVFYTLLYLPMSPFAVVGILFFGFGFLPLTPLLSLVCTLRLRARLARQQSERSQPLARGWWWSAAGAFASLALFALPAPLTRHWLDQAGSDSPAESLRALRLLRTFGSEEVMLKECYGRSDRLATELWNTRRVNSDLAQKTFYRVTGKAYNSVPPPLSKYQRSARDLFDDFEWDSGLGGESVAGQVKGLSLSQSRLDSVCQPDEGWAYLQWTMEFRNDHEWSEREARAQVQLPPGAVVSRVTLWVNGEPREAAFAGRGEVREAYQKVAVQQRRDPVLVTTSGPDRVLMQCYPVPAKGGTMKIRLGITAPLLIEQTNTALLRMPCLAERNFKIRPSFEHSFWLETPQKVQADFARLTVDNTQAGKSGVRGQIADGALGASDAVVRFEISPKNIEIARAADPKTSGRVVRQTLEPVAVQMPSRVAVVLDGSEDMTPAFPEIARALEGLPFIPELTIWFAQDDVTQPYNSAWPGGRSASASVRELRGKGGQDDLPALLQAWEWAAAKPSGALLWIHGAQPVLLSGVETFKQRLEWKTGPDAPSIIDVSVQDGPNRITEQLSTATAFTALPRVGRLSADLERLFATWTGRRTEFAFKRVLEAPATMGATPTNAAHIVRLWAVEEVRRLANARRIAEAVRLAGDQQLVTTVSGAVVLETKAQYEMTGLTPADPATVPTVPEPATWALFGLGLLTWAWLVRLKKAPGKKSGVC